MYKYLLAALLLLLPVLSAPAFAADEDAPAVAEEVIVSSATGEGNDAASALDNAFRKTVAEAVDSLIDEQARIEYKSEIDNKIIARSRSFVQKHEVVGKPEIRGGKTRMQVSVTIAKEQLWRALQDAGIINVTL